MSVHLESLPRGRQRVTSCDAQPQQATPSGYELVYLARTGTRADEPKFRVVSQYVDMAPGKANRYENVEPKVAIDTIYDSPRDLGAAKAYENVHVVNERKVSSTPPESSASVSSRSSSWSKSTPDSPSQLPFQPPTPDHPPPAAHLAEQSIHLRIRPLSEVSFEITIH